MQQTTMPKLMDGYIGSTISDKMYGGSGMVLPGYKNIAVVK